MKILTGYTITYGYILFVLIITAYLKKKKYLKEETSRKLVHILVGFSWFIMILFLYPTFNIVILPLTFIFINYISSKKEFLTAIEREKNNSKGTIFYALSFTILAFITYLHPKFLPFYGIGVLTMAIGDGLAPFFGQLLPSLKIVKTNKTYGGSLIILLSTLIIILLFNNYYILNYSLIDIILISLISPILELISYQGIDNLTLPIGIAILSYIFTL